MRISVLVPTRDRNDLLAMALASVLDQSHADLQVVVSDNASVTPALAAVPALADSRVRLLRHEGLLPVADNWNAADQTADGDYTLMLGDDDALMPGAIARVESLAREWGEPDLIFSSAWFYAWPGAVEGFSDGFAKRDASPIFAASAPRILDVAHARSLVRDAMAMRMSYPFNMQFSFVHRRLRAALPDGRMYKSPYPDYYATNACFWRALRILVVPDPLVIIGISPKSYGHMHFKGREAEGGAQHAAEDTLAATPIVGQAMLPGSRSASCFLSAMAYLAEAIPEVGRPDIACYRKLQIKHHARRRYLMGSIPDLVHHRFVARLSHSERWFGLAPLAVAGTTARYLGLARSTSILHMARRLLGRCQAGALEFSGAIAPPPGVRDILAARAWLAQVGGD